jgi:hypothetical protein
MLSKYEPEIKFNHYLPKRPFVPAPAAAIIGSRYASTTRIGPHVVSVCPDPAEARARGEVVDRGEDVRGSGEASARKGKDRVVG